MRRRAFLLAGAALPLALTRPGRLLAGGTPLALVTADLEAHVAVVDLAAGRVVYRLPTEAGPRSIESVRGSGAVIAHTQLGLVTLLDGPRSVRRVLDGFGEPRYTAVHPASPIAGSLSIAYVTDSERGEVVTLDVGRGRIIRRAQVGGPARHISASPDGTTLWTSLGSKASRVAILDANEPSRPRLIDTLSPPFLAHDVAFSPDGRRVWVSSGDEEALAIYEPGRSRPLRVIRGGAPPQHVTFAHGLVFVASGDDGSVRVHRPDGRFVRAARVPLGSYNVTTDSVRIVTPSLSAGTLCVLDDRGQGEVRLKVARAAHDACLVVGV